MKKEFKFLFTFLIISSLLYVIISMYYSKDLPIIGTSNVSHISNEILNFIGIKTYLVDDTIYLYNNISLEIVLECTGLYEMIIFSSIILSYPTVVRNKLYGILLGVTIIYILNMLRLISISLTLVYYTDKFNFIDRYLWQISLVIFISATYMIWLKSIPKIPKTIGQSNSL